MKTKLLVLISVLFVLCFNVAYATSVNDIFFTNVTGIADFGVGKNGVLITPNFDITNVTGQLFDGTNPTASSRCAIYNVTNTNTNPAVVGNVTFTVTGTNITCAFGSSVILKKGDRYVIMGIPTGSGTPAFNQGYFNVANPYPINKTNVAFLNGTFYMVGNVVTLYSSGTMSTFRNISSVSISAPVATNTTFNAFDQYTNNSITTFCLAVQRYGVGTPNITTCTTNGTVLNFILNNDTNLYRLVYTSNESGKYFNTVYENVNVTSNINRSLYRTAISSVTFTNNMTVGSLNYIRNVSYNAQVVNCTGSNTFWVFENNTNITSQTVNCGSGQNTVSVLGTFQAQSERLVNVSFNITATEYARFRTGNTTFFSDLYNPSYNFTYNITPDLNTASPTYNTTLWCNDTVFSPLYYNLTYDGSGVLFANYTANTSRSNSTTLTGGSKVTYFACSDLFGTNASTFNFSRYVATILLWDELFNEAFNLSYTSGARLWQEQNSTYFDFKVANRNNVSIVTTNLTKLRIDQNFSGGDSVSRYIDLEYTTDNLIKVCTNRDGTTHYQQLVYSALNKYASIKNSYNSCYILSDFTRFAYQDAYSVVAYTVNSNYYLYTILNNATTLLASIDGVIQAQLNLDNLEFTQEGFDVDVRDDSLVISDSGITNTTLISYQNIEQDNSAVSLAIYRADDGTLLTNITNISTPNLWDVYFYWSGYPNTNESTVFYAVATITKTDGAVQTLSISFDGKARSGIINKYVGSTLAFFMLIGGMTLFSASAVLGWIGLLITLTALVINILTEPNMVSEVLYVVLGVVLLYQLILMLTNKNRIIGII